MESKNLNNGKKVVTFGEVMLRLTTPGFKRLRRQASLWRRMEAVRRTWLFRWPTSGCPPSL